MTESEYHNMMYRERYVSKEVAIKLKEKGFLENARIPVHIAYYDTWGLSHDLYRYYEQLLTYGAILPAPTQQMATDWLDSKGIFIDVSLAEGGCKYTFCLYNSHSGKVIPNSRGWDESLESLYNCAILRALQEL